MCIIIVYDQKQKREDYPRQIPTRRKQKKYKPCKKNFNEQSGNFRVVARTLLVGDAPRDIVFAGTGGNRALITTAHRGQQVIRAASDPEC